MDQEPVSDSDSGGMPAGRPLTGLAGETTGAFQNSAPSAGDETILSSTQEYERIGDFEILGKLGQGGMGAVYRARQVSLDRQVALKLLPGNFEADSDFVARFQREARIAASLSHANLVRVYSSGVADGSHFIAMELVEGETLAQFVRRGPLSPPDALRICLDVARALECGWDRAQLIHRDIKPGNIFLSTSGEVKVGDLGLAKSMTGDTTGLTHTGTAMGTPHYISPEQARGDKDLDFRVDIYSLGCTLYQMLTGRTPYEGTEPVVVLNKHLNAPPPAILKVLPQCPIPLARLVAKMLKKAKRERHGSYAELISEIERVQAIYAPSEEATLASTVPLDPGATLVDAPTPVPGASTPRPPTTATSVPGNHQPVIRLYVAIAGGVLVLAGLAAFLVPGKSSKSPARSAAVSGLQKSTTSTPSASTAPSSTDPFGSSLPGHGWEPVALETSKLDGNRKLERLADGWTRMAYVEVPAPLRQDAAIRARLRFTGGDTWPLKVRGQFTETGGHHYDAGIAPDGSAVRLLRRVYLRGASSFPADDKILATVPLPTPLKKGQEFQLALTAVGDDISVYFNNRRLIQTQDSYCRGNLAAFGSNGSVDYKDAEWLPLESRTETVSTPAQRDGTTARENWQKAFFRPDQYGITPASEGFLLDRQCFADLPDGPKRDGAIRCRATLVDPAIAFGLTARSSRRDGRRFVYRLNLTRDRGAIHLHHDDERGSTHLRTAQLPASIAVGDDFDLELRVVGPRVTGIVNGREVLVWEGADLTPGDFGMFTQAVSQPQPIKRLEYLVLEPAGASSGGNSSTAAPNTPTVSPDEKWENLLADRSRLSVRGAAELSGGILRFSDKGTVGTSSAKLRNGAIRMRAIHGGVRVQLFARDTWKVGTYYCNLYPGNKLSIGMWNEQAATRSISLGDFALPSSLAVGEEYELELRVVGNKLSVKYNGQPIASATDDLFTIGSFGVRAIELKPIEGPEGAGYVKSLEFLELES